MSAEDAPCALCGASECRPRFRSPAPEALPAGAYAATTDRFGAYGTVVSCVSCGHLYTRPRPSARELLAGYEAHEDPLYAGEEPARRLNARRLLEAVARRRPSGRLLEVGCARGYLLAEAAGRWEAVGVEPAAAAREAARAAGLDVRSGTLEGAGFPAASFDAVVLADLLEHVVDPPALLRECARVLRPGGVLVLVTPDAGSLAARLLGGRWWGLRPAHLHYFTAATLRRALAEAGLDCVELSGYGRCFSGGYWLSRLAEYPAWLRGPLGVLMRACGLDRRLLYLDSGDSLLAVALKTSPTGN